LEVSIVNAAFLLVTTAWLAGADQAPPKPAPAPAPAPAVVGAPGSYGYADGCNSGCNNDCGGCGHSCFGKLKGLFHRGGDCCNDCNGCNGSYGAPVGGPIHAEPIPAPKSGDAPKKMPEPPKSAQILQPSVAPASTLIIEQ
jgi:hypothetical protein